MDIQRSDTKVTGLDTFAETGLGDFTASRPLYDDGIRKDMDRYTFHLGRDTLDYEWERTSDGQHYATISMVSLKREAPLATVTR
jgi:hypothetical protein